MLLTRVPFRDADLERALNLPRGACDAARGLRLEAEPGERLAGYLAGYVVEGAIVDTDVAEWSDTPTEGNPGARLYVRCPACGGMYVLGSVKPLFMLETGHVEPASGLPINLVYYTGDTVRCPTASHGRCTAPARSWAPWPVRIHPSVAAVEALCPS